MFALGCCRGKPITQTYTQNSVELFLNFSLNAPYCWACLTVPPFTDENQLKIYLTILINLFGTKAKKLLEGKFFSIKMSLLMEVNEMRVELKMELVMKMELV